MKEGSTHRDTGHRSWESKSGFYPGLEVNTLFRLALLWVFPAGMLPTLEAGVFLGIIGSLPLCFPAGKVASVYLIISQSLTGGLPTKLPVPETVS